MIVIDISEELKNTLYPDIGKEDQTENEFGMGVIQEVDEESSAALDNGGVSGAQPSSDLHFDESEDYSEAQSEEEWDRDGDRDENLGTQDYTQGDQSLSEGGNEGVLMDASELEAAIPSRPKRVSCPEDDDFLSALDKMVSDNIQDRMRDSVKPQQVDISVPLHVKSTKKTYEQLQVKIFASVCRCNSM